MIHSLSSLTDTNTKQVGRMIITKAIGYMSDEMENDYEHITENYKSKEGTLEWWYPNTVNCIYNFKKNHLYFCNAKSLMFRIIE